MADKPTPKPASKMSDSDAIPQHKRLAMGMNISQGKDSPMYAKETSPKSSLPKAKRK